MRTQMWKRYPIGYIWQLKLLEHVGTRLAWEIPVTVEPQGVEGENQPDTQNQMIILSSVIKRKRDKRTIRQKSVK